MDLLTPSFGVFFWQFITFCSVLLILKKVAWGVITKNINDRESFLNDAIINGKKISEELDNIKKIRENVLKEANLEGSKIIDDAVKRSNTIIQDAKDNAELTANNIIKEAKNRTENEYLNALDKYRKEVGVMSVQIAEKLLSRELSKGNKQEKLLNDLVDSLYNEKKIANL